MSPVDSAVCSPEWLTLREEADADARSAELAGYLTGLSGVVRDLGCGTGSMTRWLAPRLPGVTGWVLQDRDPQLLDRARSAAAPVTTLCADLTTVRAADLAGTALVTASALLDLLTADEVDAVVEACLGAGCAALLVLNVTGEVAFDPAEPLDREFAAAFDEHQRRTVHGRRLLGPDAGAHVAQALARGGGRVLTRPSPWRLGSIRPALTASWLDGWLAAACAQRPGLTAHAESYRRRRLASCAAGGLTVTVGHLDVLHLPSGTGS
ncbi:class I SAM-dependent methyltransferase [Saccharopolyspora sp. NPDC002376]